jgi:hypothetical protein
MKFTWLIILCFLVSLLSSTIVLYINLMINPAKGCNPSILIFPVNWVLNIILGAFSLTIFFNKKDSVRKDFFSSFLTFFALPLLLLIALMMSFMKFQVVAFFLPYLFCLIIAFCYFRIKTNKEFN